MRVAIFGSGYVGLVTGVCFSDLGNNVISVDIDQQKVKTLSKGHVPIYEPGLKELLDRNLQQKRLLFTTDAKKAIEESTILFICVGTPPKPDGQANLEYVYAVSKTIGTYMNDYKVIVMKSTVPVGTNHQVERIIKENLKNKIEFDVVSNPEFLREGAAIKDFQNPDRIVVGVESERAKQLMEKLYKPIARTTRPLVFTTRKSAELIKYASNSMLATRISFMNELSFLCEEVGANVKEVAKGMGLDTRIGHRFLHAGCGYGGSCFPKDVKALAQTMEHYGLTSELLRSVDYINERQKKSLLPKLKKFLPKLEDKKIAVWGLTFKPRTDDIRESPALTVIDQLQKENAKITAFDPEGIENAKKVLKGVIYGKDPYDAVKGADALLVLTEWDVFRNIDLEEVKKLMKQPILIDGRNIYDPKDVEELGFKYTSIGR